jgi:hypothetical protein
MKADKKLITIVVFGLMLMVACSPKTWQAFVKGTEAVYLKPIDTAKTDPCSQTINYAPSQDYPEHTPMRYIRVRFLIMQGIADDPNTLSPEEAPAYVKRLLELVNERLSVNAPMTLPVGNETPALPTSYRFVLHHDPNNKDDNGIDFATDSLLAYFDIRSGVNGSYDKRAYEKYARYKDEVLTMVMQEHHPDSIKSPTYSAKSTGTGFISWVKVVGAKQFLETKILPDGTKEVSGHRISIILHETGHSFGLMHTWAGDNCDDTPNNPNCWDRNSEKCPDGIYSNNVMDYNNRQNSFTPCQLGIIHYNFSTLVRAHRKYLVPVWCEYKKEATIVVSSSGELWSGAKDLEGDVVIQNGATLTIRCRVSLPKGAKIIIKPKGTLILDGAHLTNLCDQNWEGIEVWGNKTERGSLIIYEQPTIDHVSNPIALPSLTHQ